MRTRVRHGMTKNPAYHSWLSARHRCENPKDPAYARYGGRGVYMCREWSESFSAFFEAMGDRPEGTTLERIDNDGPYCASNCKWATIVEQGRNKRNNHLLTAFGRTQCYSAWSEETGIDRRTIWGRIERRGWSVERALSTPAAPSPHRPRTSPSTESPA